jgi:hypothetical protein
VHHNGLPFQRNRGFPVFVKAILIIKPRKHAVAVCAKISLASFYVGLPSSFDFLALPRQLTKFHAPSSLLGDLSGDYLEQLFSCSVAISRPNCRGEQGKGNAKYPNYGWVGGRQSGDIAPCGGGCVCVARHPSSSK